MQELGDPAVMIRGMIIPAVFPQGFDKTPKPPNPPPPSQLSVVRESANLRKLALPRRRGTLWFGDIGRPFAVAYRMNRRPEHHAHGPPSDAHGRLRTRHWQPQRRLAHGGRLHLAHGNAG